MKKRLLIVDDDVDVLESLKLLLENSYDVCLSRNGKEALMEMDRGFHADAILLDLQMPEMDGAGVVAELNRRGSRTPILIVTANWNPKALHPELEGMEVLRKPFTYEQLREKLDRILRSSGDGIRAGRHFLASLLVALLAGLPPGWTGG